MVNNYDWIGADPNPDTGLTSKQEMFCRAYVASGFDVAIALREAGYSEQSGGSRPREILESATVKQRIAALAELKLLGMRVTAGDLLSRMGAIALFNITDVVSWNEDGRVTFRPSAELTDAAKFAIKRVRSKRSVTVNGDTHNENEIEFEPKMPALKLLMAEHKKLFEEMRATGELQDPIGRPVDPGAAIPMLPNNEEVSTILQRMGALQESLKQLQQDEQE